MKEGLIAGVIYIMADCSQFSLLYPLPQLQYFISHCFLSLLLFPEQFSLLLVPVCEGGVQKQRQYSR